MSPEQTDNKETKTSFGDLKLIETEEEVKQTTQESSPADAAKEAAQTNSSAKVTLTPPAKKSAFSLSNLRAKKPPAEIIEKPSEPARKKRVHLSDIMEHKIEPETIKPPKKLSSFSSEMSTAKLTHGKTGSLLKNVMEDIKKGNIIIDTPVVEQAIHSCMESVLRSPDAMLLAMNLKGKHHNIWQHSMNVSMLAISLGRQLNLADEELVTLGLCGMFHDIGTLLISKEDIEKAGDKRELIHSHTTLGGDLLSKCPGQLNGIVAEVAYSHHENLDGSGFPKGLKDENITAYTRIVTIADLYDTLTTDASNRKALNHYEAMIKLLKGVEKQHLDKALVNSFNLCIGTYPVGSYVEMNTGEIGVVVEENPEQRLKPVVVLLTTADKKKCHKKVLNLAKVNADGSINSHSIKGIVRPEQYALKP